MEGAPTPAAGRCSATEQVQLPGPVFPLRQPSAPYFKFQNNLIGTGPFRGMEPMAALSSPFKGWRYQVLQGDIRSKGGPGPPLGTIRNSRTGGQLVGSLPSEKIRVAALPAPGPGPEGPGGLSPLSAAGKGPAGGITNQETCQGSMKAAPIPRRRQNKPRPCGF